MVDSFADLRAKFYEPAYVAGTRVVFDGQSLAVTPSAANCVSTKLFDMIQGAWTCPNLAVAGTTYNGRASTSVARYGAILAPNRYSVVVDIAGQSDLWAGTSAASLYSTAASYWTGVRLWGADKVVAFTVPYATNFALNDSYETARRAYNALLLAGVGTQLDAVVDMASWDEFQDLNSPYFADGLHPSDAGAALMAERLWPVIDALGVP